VATEPGQRAVQHPLDEAAVAGFVAELVGKSDLVWVQASGGPTRPVWSVWHDGAVAVVTGGIEQPNPGLADGEQVTVIVRSKENRARQVAFRAAVTELVAGSETWDSVVGALAPQRLNAPDAERQPERWAHESTVWQLHPTAETLEQPGAFSDDAGRAEPLPSDATTLTRKPFHAGRATKKRKRR